MLQEQPATALLNLLIDEANKRIIAREGAIPAIIDILQNGTEEARENSTAALFSLSMLDENRVLVGTSNGIPSLVNLLQDGTIRGRKDAATALFNLSLNQTNKFRAIKADIITPWLHLLGDKNIGMIDEALSILLLLASHPKGRSEIGRLSFIRTLVEIIKSGTPKNKECATSVLLELEVNNSSFTLAALQYGVYEHLIANGVIPLFLLSDDNGIWQEGEDSIYYVVSYSSLSSSSSPTNIDESEDTIEFAIDAFVSDFVVAPFVANEVVRALESVRPKYIVR
ncbi:hypothetical protein GH714_025442 [Hevea brasiliensis]|uniref:U-box domain-containing protein n=1 Tax=Hevea brasiliensis TaxID=3981 RepID=A0A6A6NAJ4_HEVBR|nr:hypothetical protein GH714_025442 [Hevea brasiliensis]